jgi:hypothetical protein
MSDENTRIVRGYFEELGRPGRVTDVAFPRAPGRVSSCRRSVYD